MEAVADLQLLDLAQVIVDAREMLGGGIAGIDAEIAGEAQGLAALEDPLAEVGQAAGIECGRLVVLVDQGLELRELAPALGTGHGWGEVVDNDRSRTALGLGALAGVVDDERVEVGHRPEHGLGQAGGGKGGGLAGQPFEVAVLAKMDDRMRAEAVAQPEVEGEIAVRRRQVRRVIGGVGVDVVAAGGLQAHDHPPHGQEREGEAVAGEVRVAFRRPPAFLDPCAHLVG